MSKLRVLTLVSLLLFAVASACTPPGGPEIESVGISDISVEDAVEATLQAMAPEATETPTPQPIEDAAAATVKAMLVASAVEATLQAMAPEATETPTPEPVVAATPAPTTVPTPPPLPTPTPTVTPTQVPTPTPTPTSTPTPPPTAISPTVVPSPTPTPTVTPTPLSLPTEITPSASPVPAPTQSPTPTPLSLPTQLPDQLPTPLPLDSLPTATAAPITAPPPPPATATVRPVDSVTSSILSLVESLIVDDKPKSALPSYDRSTWKHWNDEDNDCINARHEVLIEESTTSIGMDGNCRVATGQWFGVYTGEQFSNPSNLDVDHMVPLKNAHDSGGWAWSASKKEEFANYLTFANHLLAVSASANRSKGSSGPEFWKPTRIDYWCQYGTDWAEIKATWALTVTSLEKAALVDLVNNCVGSSGGNVVLPTPISGQPTQVPSTATATAVPTSALPSPTIDPSLLFDPFGPDRDCSDFSNWEDVYDFYLAAGGPSQDPHGLDGNNDGDPCESLH